MLQECVNALLCLHRGCAAHNNANHDARLLYTIDLASCRAYNRPKGARHKRDSRVRYNVMVEGKIGVRIQEGRGATAPRRARRHQKKIEDVIASKLSKVTKIGE